MTTIFIETNISAPVEVCFDLSRSVDLHLDSMAHTKERTIAGRTTGLCERGDIITWAAIHFGIRQRLSVIITQMQHPHFFEDRMTAGAFKSMRHEHHFAGQAGNTLMTDVFCYEVPFGIIGWFFNALILKRYMRRLLLKRNAIIKVQAEVESG